MKLMPLLGAPTRCAQRLTIGLYLIENPNQRVLRYITLSDTAPLKHLFSLPVKLIFTDLDGSLLDHHSYSFEPAKKMLKELEAVGIPVIPITSKTKAELIPLRGLLNNSHPFIIENGAAIYIPQDYFSSQPENSISVANYWVIENAPSRNNWLNLLHENTEEFSTEFQTFDSIFKQQGVKGIAELTGLDSKMAELANQRDFSEPVHWTGTATRKKLFIEKMQSLGATVLQGGRFLNIGGATDKGRALLQLRDLYLQQAKQSACQTLAIGDSGNDISMLEKASSALIIKSDNHPPPTLTRSENRVISQQTGPQGWAVGVADWLQIHR
jgi:mannosyl-3-phosphoglycerate phosphatase